MESVKKIEIFNSETEIGMRNLVLLTISKKMISAKRLALIDYMMLYANEFDENQKNIHPSYFFKNCEISIRYKLVEKSLKDLTSLGMVELGLTEEGIKYFATHWTVNFVESLRSDYVNKLKNNSLWVFQYTSEKTEVEMVKEIFEKTSKGEL